MSTLTLDVPDSVAKRWDALTEEERQRQVATMIQTITALDITETPPATAPPVRAFADEILEILGPEFAFDPKKQGTRTTARHEYFSDMDIMGKGLMNQESVSEWPFSDFIENGTLTGRRLQEKNNFIFVKSAPPFCGQLLSHLQDTLLTSWKRSIMGSFR